MDEAAKNPDFFKFRQELERALDNKDLGFLIKHTDENIKVSFGGQEGIDDFIKFWELDRQPQQSKVWKTLQETMRLGGEFEENNLNSFIAPYPFLAEEISDPFSEIIVTGKEVRLRQNPSLQGQILGLLSYDVVTFIYEENPPEETIKGETYPWLKVKTAEGLQGYVYGKYLRSPVDYRANFKKKGSTWKMTFFVAGD